MKTLVRLYPLVLLSLLAALHGDAVGQQPQREMQDRTLLNDVDAALGKPVPISEKWIGVLCRPADDLIRAHVTLPKNCGLVIEEVIPESPAQQAGLKKHDILVLVDEDQLTDLNVLVRGIAAADDDGLTLRWVRGGESMSGIVIPADRPAAGAIVHAHGDVEDEHGDMGRLRAWIEGLEKGQIPGGGERPLQLRFFGPEIAAGRLQGFPADLSVSVQKDGQEPARIVVKKGDATWEVSEDSLDELPDEVRPFVQNMLKGGIRVQGGRPQWNPLDRGLERRIDEMNEQMERVFEELRQLREQAPPDEDGDSIDA